MVETGLTTAFSEDKVSSCLGKFVSLALGEEYAEFKIDDVPLLNSGLMDTIRHLSKRGGSNQIHWTSEMLSESDGLSNSSEFCFKVGDERFECPKVLAQLLSNTVLELSLSDSSINMFELNLPDGCSREEYSDAFGLVFGILRNSVIPERFKAIMMIFGGRYNK